ncbi:hypothetical protein DM02DRAFT_685168 [Periconia macrospinosa]|uniref:ATP-dependent DNA ligase family profile domain-containing protein n=1 Tax=Periconia macrospinosa TaxID=97972 RepID=A0A2V1DJ96_9PLEO|nr:hypothetical protein DM02DRAFT_685168 [Periconia macrospinosa]
MSLNFHDICLLLEGVEKIQTQRARTAHNDKAQVETKTKEKIVEWFKTHRGTLDHPRTNGAPILSIIFPHRRKDRVYGLQAPTLAKMMIKLLNFNHGRKALFERWSTDPSGDIGHHLEIAMKPWDGTFKKKRQFPIERIDALLTQIAAKYRFSDPAIRKQRDRDMSTDEELSYILKRLDSWEAKWLIRVLLREYSTITIDENHFFKQYHFLLPDLLTFQNDFGAAFGTLRGHFGCFPSVPPPGRAKSMRAEAAGKLKATVGVKVSRPTFHKAWSLMHCLQLVGDRAWAAEVKYDGEYCEIHINLDHSQDDNEIQIFSKNGKDATADREALKSTILEALRIGQLDCRFRRKCIVLGEMVLYSDRDQSILPFSKIRKHVSRSGTFIGTLQDSAPHSWEHLMLVFFDVLMVDDEPIMRKDLQERRDILRTLVRHIPGRSQRSEWTLLDFKTEHGTTDLKQAFARTLAHRQEGLVLKPLHAPYLPLFVDGGPRNPNYFIKLKRDYLADMGGERDLGDFAVIGARFDPQVAPKSDLTPLHWTHCYLGCLMNESAVRRSGAKPKFKVVACLSLDMCIPRPELKYLNTHGYFRKKDIPKGGRSIETFDFSHGKGYERRMTVAFKKPFVAEILGGGYEKVQNETFEMLRHPRVKKVHHDRTWEDAVTMDNLKRMAEEKWDVPDATALDGHAKDVAVLAKRYYQELHPGEDPPFEYETTQETTQRTTQRTTQDSNNSPQELPHGAAFHESQSSMTEHATTSDYETAPEEIFQDDNNTPLYSQRTTQLSSEPSPRQYLSQYQYPSRGSEVPETQQQQQLPPTTIPNIPSSPPSTQFSTSSTQAVGIRASRELRSILVRQDTSERLALPAISPPSIKRNIPRLPRPPPLPPSSDEAAATKKGSKRARADEDDDQRPSKRVHRSVRWPLRRATGNRRELGSFEFDSQEGVLRVFGEQGVRVVVVGGDDDGGGEREERRGVSE